MARKHFNWFLIIRLAGIVLFLVVLSRTNLKELWGWMKEIDQAHLFLAIMFQVILLLVKGFRWYILNETGFNLKKLVRRSGEFFEGYAMGVITPGRVGELMKAGHAGSRAGILGAGLRVVAERGMDLSIYFVIAGIAISRLVLPGVEPFWGWLILVTGIAGMLVSMLILISPVVVKMAEKILKMIRVLKKDKSLEFYHRSVKSTFLFLFLSLFSNLSYFVCCFFLATGVGMNLPVISVAGGVATAGVLNTIPVTVMGLGTREVTFIYVFNSFPLAQVMAFSGLVFLIAQIGGGLVSLVLGQVFLWIGKRQKRTVNQ
jgi:glycosyltransferase 2 family protein